MENKDYQNVWLPYMTCRIRKMLSNCCFAYPFRRRNRSMCHADRHIIDSYRRNQRIHLPRPDKRHAGFYAALEVARYTIRCDLQRFLRFIRTTGPRQRVFRTIQIKNNLILVDPVMADNGELYRIFQPEFATGMRSLCRKADIIVPNLTEAALLLEESYHPGPYTQAYIEKS